MGLYPVSTPSLRTTKAYSRACYPIAPLRLHSENVSMSSATAAFPPIGKPDWFGTLDWPSGLPDHGEPTSILSFIVYIDNIDHEVRMSIPHKPLVNNLWVPASLLGAKTDYTSLFLSITGTWPSRGHSLWQPVSPDLDFLFCAPCLRGFAIGLSFS